MEARNSNASSDFGPFLQSPSGQPSAPVFLYLCEVAKATPWLTVLAFVIGG